MPLLFHAFSTAKHFYVFDANTNSVISVSGEQHAALSQIEQGRETQENLVVLRELQAKGFCREANIERIHNPNTDVMAAHLEKKIQQIIIQVTQRCNLRCDYCAYSGLYKNRTHSPKSMGFETAKRAIDMALSHSEDTKIFIISFFGGEPLLELPLIKKCVEYIKRQAPNRNILYSMTTNGTLLTPEVYGYLSDNNFNIAISLDGPKQIHDMSRKYPNGKGSYDTIMENIKAIQAQYPKSCDKLRFNAVLSPEADESCLPKLFKSDDVLSYYNHNATTVSDVYIDNPVSYSDAFSLCFDRELCKLLLSMLGKLKKENVSVLFSTRETTIKQEYNRLIKIPRINPVCHPGGPCLAGAMRPFVNVEGILFPCERVSENSRLMAIGDLDHGFDFEKVRTVMNPGQVTEEQCKKCWVINHCTLCAAYSDDLTGLSKRVRLSNCRKARSRYEETLKILCFLKEAGYAFAN